MAIVLQSSWFWLAIIATLFTIVGCVTLIRHHSAYMTNTNETILSQMTVAPAFMPPDILQFPTQTRLFNPIPTLIPRFGTSPPPDDDLILRSARCYQLANTGYSCLGEVFNAGNDNLGRLSLQYQPDSGSNAQVSTTEQRLLPPNGTMPYRILIPPEIVPNREILADFTIESALIRAYPPAPNIRRLTVSEVNGELTDTGRYHLQMTILNETNFSAHDIRVITTLRHNEWGIVGYQVYEVGNVIESGTSHALDLEIIPSALPERIEHTIHVEGLVDN